MACILTDLHIDGHVLHKFTRSSHQTPLLFGLHEYERMPVLGHVAKIQGRNRLLPFAQGTGGGGCFCEKEGPEA
jgi:hypothetical protein